MPRRTVHAVLAAVSLCKPDHICGSRIKCRSGGCSSVGHVHRNRKAAGYIVMVRCARLEVDRAGVCDIRKCRHCAVLAVLRQAIRERNRLIIHSRGSSCNLRRLCRAGICQSSALLNADVCQRRILDLVLNACCHRAIAGAKRDACFVCSHVNGSIFGSCTVCSVSSFHIVKDLRAALNAIFIRYDSRVCCAVINDIAIRCGNCKSCRIVRERATII